MMKIAFTAALGAFALLVSNQANAQCAACGGEFSAADRPAAERQVRENAREIADTRERAFREAGAKEKLFHEKPTLGNYLEHHGPAADKMIDLEMNRQ